MAAPLIADRAPAGATTGAASVPRVRDTARLAFIDNIRVFLTVLVIAHHAGQTYGPTGATGRSSTPSAPRSWGRSSASTPPSSWASSP